MKYSSFMVPFKHRTFGSLSLQFTMSVSLLGIFDALLSTVFLLLLETVGVEDAVCGGSQS